MKQLISADMLKNIYYEPNEELKEKNLQLAQKETVPFYLIRFDKHVEENEGYFVNGQVSLRLHEIP